MTKNSNLLVAVTCRCPGRYAFIIKSHRTPMDLYIFHTRADISRGWIYSDGQCLLAGYIPQDRTQVIEDAEG